MSTFLVQVKACLNSRPLSPLSNDPSDLTPLTPGHFITGRPLLAVPDTDIEPSSRSIHSIWRLLSHFRSDFWRRWTQEYLHYLQSRPKWRIERQNINPAAMVLLVDEQMPPTRWALGRVTEVNRGPDGHVRVVTIRTAKGTTSRAIVKVCQLPIPAATED